MSKVLMGARKIESMKLLEALITERNHGIIDVRTPIEYRDGTFFDAPNSALRNFITVYGKMRKDTNKIVLIGSKQSMKDLEACIRYANNFPQVDKKLLNLSYVLYEDLVVKPPEAEKGTRRRERRKKGA